MTNRILYLLTGSILFIMNSCNTIVYTTASNIQPVTQAPPSLEKKGDIQIYGGYESYNSRDPYYWSPDVDIAYINLGRSAANASIQGAVSDHMAVGLNYKFDKYLAASGHGLTASFTGFKNYSGKKTNRIGFDVTTGFSWNIGDNFMSVDSVFFDLYVIDAYEYDIYFDYNISHQGYYMIDKMDIKAFVQPSFTFENRIFELHLGGSVGYHYRHQYDPGFFYKDDLVDEEFHNPLVYYNRNKHFAFGEYFMSIGMGSEHVRVLGTLGAGHRNDLVQPSYVFGQIGIRGRF